MEAMTTEQEVTETPQVEQSAPDAPEVEAAPVNDDAAFLAGFTGEELPAPAAEPEPEPEPEPQPEVKTEPVPTLTAEEVAVLRAKAAEVDRLRETTSKLSGSLGAMRQAIDNLKNQPKGVSSSALRKLADYFPELADTFNEEAKGAEKQSGAPAVDVDAVVEEKLTARLQEQKQAVEAKLLSVMHPDWKAVVPSDEFGKWKASLDEQTRQSLDESWDAEFIGQKISEFKDWKKQTAASVQTKQRRLEAAITPRGSVATTAKTDEDAFYEGFKNARAGR